MWVVSFVLSSCAGPQQEQRVIEPPSASGNPSAKKANAEGDTAFVLSRQAPTAQRKLLEYRPVHVGDEWWRFRADFLKLTEAQVRERDNGISDKQAPQEFWDEQTALESVSIWGSLCNECHGGRRRIEDALGMPPPVASWGRGEGLFFGSRRPYAEVFATIWNGAPERNGKKSQMPAWRGKLAREQVWSLLYFLEYQSGGIVGRFPPSLYPRMQNELRD